MKKVKPETEIRNLKKQVSDLRLLCQAAGVPLLITYLPEIYLKRNKSKISKDKQKKNHLFQKKQIV